MIAGWSCCHSIQSRRIGEPILRFVAPLPALGHRAMLGSKLRTFAFLTAGAVFVFAVQEESGRTPKQAEKQPAKPGADTKPYDGHPRLFFDGPAAKNGLLKNL